MKFFTSSQSFLHELWKNSMPITRFIAFVLQVIKWSSINQPSLPLQFRHLSVWIHQSTWQQYTVQSRQVRQTNKAWRVSSTSSFPALSTKDLETFPFTGHTSQTAKINSFPDLYTIKESKEKTSLRTGSSWFGFFLTSIKKRSWKLYLPRATTFPLGICSKTPKLNITYGLTLISLNTKLHNYPRILHKQISNLVDWGSLYARHH